MSVDRKKLILEAATKSFTQFGYKATTMDLVAKLANVGKGTIYTFFKNKEELFDDIFTTILREMKEHADEAMKPELSFHENVHRALVAILEFRKTHQLTIKIFQENAEIGTIAVQDVIAKMERAILSYIKEKIEWAIENGSIKPCDPELTAFVMLKLYIALIFDWEKNHPPLEKETIAELLEMYVGQGLSK
ncbi:TetR/AcrR family transcriptional regulator [Bacillus siamensis]|uniref:TetR/AcrR family transcriptional regulator n=1 Tax=Bacillus siamensis TaxID=659243 RepID=UPI0005F95CDD|nr:TetR/AcrR family transcriptional regulator [Bacillus siamensis]MDU0813432.1 TetR/AcrR family transcriptional regulator [Bacillus siamensis]MED0772487.1 TetR/AcrR family transcriptional regulator [Bacillus siamensis]MED0776378.1 TetR/AcrR family transcriptional regulator [Bacillus siamensis]MED0778241.1 TetR/AcrR family transcriptional regulator [Bacillus siamensis]MED0835098.1 TetR/AcrR family transcriptional regulator [Bacillus siamensis]